jgi:apolipoprotein D and lipocalin family protein
MKFLLSILSALVLSGCFFEQPSVNRDPNIPLNTVSFADTNKYLGKWYEIARFPNDFQGDFSNKSCYNVSAEYKAISENEISVINSCLYFDPKSGAVKTSLAEGKAKIVDLETRAKLKVRFGLQPEFAAGDYWILYLSENYSLSVVGEPSGRYLWILSRSKTINESTYLEILSFLEDLGYNTEALVRNPQN